MACWMAASAVAVRKGRSRSAAVLLMVCTVAYRPVLELHGWGALQEELIPLNRAHRNAEMAALITDEMVETIAIVGTPEQCAATLQEYIDIGCTSFCLSGYYHHDEAERFGRWVRPILEERNPGRLKKLAA